MNKKTFFAKKFVIWLIVIITFLFVFFSLFILISYPTKYRDKIEKYSTKYNLSPSMVASVIKIESNYNPNAISSAGAIGLMQLMPTTASEIANKLGKDWNYNDLFDVDNNIEIGCYYLRYLLDIFKEDTDNSLSSYNWGLNNVKTWILKGNVDGYGTITNIPVVETSKYLKKYRRAKFMYSDIFGYDL